MKGLRLELTFPKDFALIRELQSAIPAADWDRLKEVWYVPASELADVIEFAKRHRFTVEEELLKVDMPPKPRNAFNTMTIEKGQVFVYAMYEDVRVAELKTIRGVIFDKKKARWIVGTGCLSEVIDWCDRWSVRVPDMCRAVANYHLRSSEALRALSGAVGGVELSIPTLQGDLMAHQKVGVAYCARLRRTFIADDIGVGKTLTALAALEYVHTPSQPSYPALITCPPKLGLNWVKEVNRWFPNRTVQFISKKAELSNGSDITIIGNAILSAKRAELHGYRSVIHDEAHSYKTATAQRTKAALEITRTVPDDGIVLCLTGTPITIRPLDYVPQLKILGLLDPVFGSEMAFYRNYCGAKQIKGGWDFSGATNLEELNAVLRSRGYVRRERTDVLHDLPPAFHRDTLVELSTVYRKDYLKAEHDVVDYLVERARQIAEEMGENPHSAAVRARIKAEAGRHLVKVSVLRKLAALGKMEAVTEWVGDRVEEGRKLIVAAHHREVVDAFAEKFGGLKIQGGMNNRQIEDHKRRFMETDAPVIVLSIQAGKEGHTLTEATDVVMVEFPWTSTDYDQTWGRAWRKGQKNNVFVHSFLGANTIDVPMFDLLADRRRNVKAATVGAPIDTAGGVVDYLMDRASQSSG